MDVWQWVYDLSHELGEAGHVDVVRLMHSLPETALSGDIVRAEGIAGDLINEARALHLPWLEIYARHWRLQAANAEQRGAASLAEATSVFELAHRDETARCPQSVCIVQDLCLTYANTDGPGFADERIAVSTETLDRIDPTWACWSCLTAELVEGMADAGRPEEAAAELDRRWAAALEVGETPSLSVELAKVTTLLLRGEHERALRTLDDMEQRTHEGWDLDRKRARIGLQRCEALARLGRGAEALPLLPDPDAVQEHGLPRDRWVATIEVLVGIGALTNDAQLGAVVHGIVEQARRGGAWRRLFDSAAVEARLAVARGAGWVARDALASMVQARGELRADRGADAALAAVRALVADLGGTVRPLPAPADQLVAHLRSLDEHDLEAEVEWLAIAAAERPDDDELVMLQSYLLGACNRDDLARRLLEIAWARRPDSEMLAAALGEVVLRGGDTVDVDGFAHSIEERFPLTAWWTLARQRSADHRWSEVADLCRKIVDADPGALNTRRLWADAARHLHDHDAAVRLLTEVIDADPEAIGPEGAARGGAGPGDHWNRMVDATVIGRWDLVRRSAQALGLPVEPGEGVIEASWEQVVIELEGPGGTTFGLAATRTGPVTARIESISTTNDPQRVADVVVFDPAPTNAPPERAAGDGSASGEDDPGDERRDFVFWYRHVATLQRGGFTGWFIDGFDPGPEQYWTFRHALERAGVRLWISSPDGYRITDPSGGDLPGIYGRVATPEGMSPVEADALLTRLTAGWAHPLSWVGLAEAAGADVARHRRIIDAYGL